MPANCTDETFETSGLLGFTLHADGCHEDMVAIFGDGLECYL